MTRNDHGPGVHTANHTRAHHARENLCLCRHFNNGKKIALGYHWSRGGESDIFLARSYTPINWATQVGEKKGVRRQSHRYPSVPVFFRSIGESRSTCYDQTVRSYRYYFLTIIECCFTVLVP